MRLSYRYPVPFAVDVVGVTTHSIAAHRRVALVLLAVALMGIADLICTLTYMTGPGMMEANPIARSVVSFGGASMLIKYKLLTIMLSAGILYCCRKHRSAEVWSWVCAGVMFALTLHWVHYNATISDMTHEVSTLAHSDAENTPREWVQITSAGS